MQRVLATSSATYDEDEKGKDDQARQISAPGAPTALTASAQSLTQIDLSWTAPADNGGATITGYKIEVSADGGGTWADLVASQIALTYSHTGLTAGSTRQYRVSAINSAGTGTASDTATGTADAYITNFGQGSGTSNEVWGSPTGQVLTTGSNAAGYTLTAVEIVSADQQGDDFSVKLWEVGSGGLPTGELFDLASPGSFARGPLTFTSSSTVRLSSSTSYAVEMARVGSGNVAIAATTSDGEDAGGGSGWSIADNHVIKRSGTWTVRNSQAYRIKVRAEAEADPTVPTEPTGLTAVDQGATQIDLSWVAPGDDGGATISGYKIEVSDDSQRDGWPPDEPDGGMDGGGGTDVEGTAFFASGVDGKYPRGFVVQIRGRWDTTWSNWTPKVSLNCREGY